MFIITDAMDVIVKKTPTGEVVEGGFLINNGSLTWSVPGAHMYEIESFPDGHGIFKSCYTSGKGFYANPDYVEPKTSIDELIAENKLLKAQVQAQTERSDFLEDCIAEMAAQVYNT